jgi:hypothetical protein
LLYRHFRGLRISAALDEASGIQLALI